MKTLILILSLVIAASCTKQTKPMPTQAQKTIIYDYRNEINASYLLQKNIHYYHDLNTVFINVSKSKGIGC
ncbi:MAG TPA: hypothetical protein VN698_01910 [Bacteroidia bacterium]|nr:hypothetical protein [Bacteroidia bacterium]